MRGLYQYRRWRLNARGGDLDDDGAEDRPLAYQQLVPELLEAQRREIVLLRNQGEISNEVTGRIEHDSTWRTPGSRSGRPLNNAR